MAAAPRRIPKIVRVFCMLVSSRFYYYASHTYHIHQSRPALSQPRRHPLSMWSPRRHRLQSITLDTELRRPTLLTGRSIAPGNPTNLHGRRYHRDRSDGDHSSQGSFCIQRVSPDTFVGQRRIPKRRLGAALKNPHGRMLRLASTQIRVR